MRDMVKSMKLFILTANQAVKSAILTQADFLIPDPVRHYKSIKKGKRRPPLSCCKNDSYLLYNNFTCVMFVVGLHRYKVHSGRLTCEIKNSRPACCYFKQS